MNNTLDDIPTKDLAFELISDNQVTFQFIKPRHSPIQKIGLVSVPFDKLETKKDILRSGSGYSFEFLIDDRKGQIKAGVVVQIKRKGNVILTSEKVIWEDQGIALKLFLIEQNKAEHEIEHIRELNNSILIANKVFILRLHNAGNIPTNTDDIKVSLANLQGVAFKLGHLEGSNINNTLSAVLGKSVAIQPNTSINFDLTIAGDAKTLDQEQATIKLIFQDKENNMLVEETTQWENNSKAKALFDKALAAAPLFKEFRDKSGLLYREIDKFNYEYISKYKDIVGLNIELYKQALSNWSNNIIQLYKLRNQAQDLTPDLLNFQKVYKEALSQNKGSISDNFKEGLEKTIQEMTGAISNNFFVEEIDGTIVEAFDFTDKRTKEFLEQANTYKGEEKTVIQSYITAIKMLEKIADKFQAEISTPEAEDLAAKLNVYKQKAEALLEH